MHILARTHARMHTPTRAHTRTHTHTWLWLSSRSVFLHSEHTGAGLSLKAKHHS